MVGGEARVTTRRTLLAGAMAAPALLLAGRAVGPRRVAVTAGAVLLVAGALTFATSPEVRQAATDHAIALLAIRASA